jgi:hypothetical protein
LECRVNEWGLWGGVSVCLFRELDPRARPARRDAHLTHFSPQVSQGLESFDALPVTLLPK